MNQFSFFINNIFDDSFIRDMLYYILYDDDLVLEDKLSSFISIYKKQLIEYEIINNTSFRNIIQSLVIIEKILISKKQSTFVKITKDNILSLYPNCNLYLIDIIENIQADKYKKSIKQNLYSKIELFLKFKESLNIFKSLDDINQKVKDDKQFEITEYFKELKSVVENITTKVFKPNSDVIYNTQLSDYLIFSENPKHVDFSISNVSDYVSEKYFLYNLGYNIYDETIEGVDNSSVNIIAAPSNHGKSLLLINLVRNFITLNPGKLDKDKDCVIFITVEDSLYKFLRRVISVFGNYSNKFIKELFNKLSNLEQNKHQEILKILFSSSISKVTNDNCNFIFKHADESTSMSSIESFINKIKSIYKYNIKAIFIDYIDVMVPNSGKTGIVYNDQGDIVINMREFVKQNDIPIFTVSQCNRTAENYKLELSNQLIGDSYNKIRYGDNISLMRQRYDTPIDSFIEQVIRNKHAKDKAIEYITITNPTLIHSIIPTEIKLTKCKDGPKNHTKFLLFNQMNLRYYDYLEDVISDNKSLSRNELDLGDMFNNIFETDGDI